MTVRPILFSGPMVRALLDGSKTQTRRVVKPQPQNDPAKHHPIEPYSNGRGGWNWVLQATGHGTGDPFPCPYGQPGDRLWVREAFSGPWCMEAQDGRAAAPPSKWARESSIWYWADGEPTHGDWTRPRPSIHMPRWASRIMLEVTGVRVERLREISEADAMAEGIERMPCQVPNTRLWRNYTPGNGWTPSVAIPQNSFRSLWESINGPGAWDANPWVWVVEFRRLP